MIKRLSKLYVTLLVTIILALSSSSSFAVENQNEVISENAVTTAVDENTEEITTDEGTTNQEANEEIAEEANQESTTKESDEYIIDKGTVTIDYTVDGNIFIIADTVNITSQIGGDAFIVANNINIDGGYIYNNLFAVGTNINVDGIVYDLYCCADNLTIGANGYVYRDVHTMTNKFNVLGPVGRNVSAILNSIAFSAEDTTATGKIFGNLDYTAENEINIDENSVEGNVNFKKAVSEPTGPSVQSYLYSLAIFVVMALVIYLLTIWLSPKYTAEAKEILTKKPMPVIGFGLLGLLVIPLVILVLLILQVTISVAFALLALYVMLLLIASSFLIITIAEIITSKIKMENKWQKLGIVVCVAVILWALKLIPYIGGFIQFVAVVLGLGIIIKKIIPQTAKKQEKIEIKEEKDTEQNN